MQTQNDNTQASWIAFAQARCIASGTPSAVATKIKTFADAHPEAGVLVFDTQSSQAIEIDLRGSVQDVLARLPVQTGAEPLPEASKAAPVRAPGRPKLGVTAREVTLLPRHWEWLSMQQGGASVALRKLVEQAQRVNKDADRMRQAQEAAYRFMNAMAGNEQGFEEATRALFAGDLQRFSESAGKWPQDIRDHALKLAAASMESNKPGLAS